MVGILLTIATMYLAVRGLQEISYCDPSGSQYRYVPFAKAWNSGDLALRYTYVEFVVVTTWNGKLWKGI